MNGTDMLDAVCVGGDGMELNSDDAKRSCVVQQELVECASGELISILIFDCDK